MLQPVAYLSKTRLDQLSLDPGQGRQYEIVYPLILKLLREEPQFAPMQASFLDLRDALDQDAYLYIDWCHLSPNGNEIVAARISEAVARLVARRIGHRRTRAHDSEGGGLARRQPGGADAGRAVHQTAAVRS